MSEQCLREELERARTMIRDLQDELKESNQGLMALTMELESRVEERTARLEHLNSMLRVIRNINQLITKERDPDRILQGTCYNLIEHRGYIGAWVATFDDGKPERVMQAGVGDGFAPLREQFERGELPACAELALGRTGVVVIEEPETVCKECVLPERFRCASSLTASLRYDDRLFGVLTVSFPGGLVADEQEIDLFEDVAGDVSFALHSMEQEQLRLASERTLRTIFDTVGAGILLCDAETHRFVRANQAMCQMLGYEFDELLGRQVGDIHPQRALPKVAAAFSRQLSGEASLAPEIPVLRKDGSVFYADINATPIMLAGRKHLLGLFRDITERKHAEEALKQSEEKHRILFESSRDAIMTLAPPSWKFTSGNPATVEMFETGDEQTFTSLGPWDLSPERQPDGQPSPDKVKVMVETAMTEGSHFFEWTHRRLGGEDFPATVLLTRMRIGDKVLLQATVRDISAEKRAAQEREQLKDQLRQAQRMEAVGQLAGGVAHDFNNLLTAIRGYTELLELDVGEDSELRPSLAEIRKASDRAAALTRQLLAFSRKQLLQPRVLDLNDAVAEMDKMLRRLIGEDVDLVFVPGDDLGRVRADPGQIDQVVMNLAVNARDAMPEGGKLTIETANVEFDEEYAKNHVAAEPGPYVMLAVSDTGTGMDAQTRARVFEPFFTTKAKNKGTGLGLSTVYGIVKQSGGYVWVYSEPSQGTAFKIYLPRVDEPADTIERRETAARAAAPRRSETVLVVEDDEAVRALATRILERAGYEVLTAQDGEEARYLAEAEQGPIQLLLTDVVMPGASGRQVAEALCRDHPGLRVLYMSGYTDNAIVHHGVLEAGTRFIQKPFTPDQLAQKVREVLDG